MTDEVCVGLILVRVQHWKKLYRISFTFPACGNLQLLLKRFRTAIMYAYWCVVIKLLVQADRSYTILK